MNPIWNAVFSSLMMKAGISVVRETSCGPAGRFSFEMETKRARSFYRVCFIMKSFTGTAARSMACYPEMRSS